MEERFEQGQIGKFSHSKPFAFGWHLPDRDVVINVLNLHYSGKDDKIIDLASIIGEPKHPEQESTAHNSIKNRLASLNTSADYVSSASTYAFPGSLGDFNSRPQSTNPLLQPLSASSVADMFGTHSTSVFESRTGGFPDESVVNLNHCNGHPYYYGPNTKTSQATALPATYSAPATSQGVSSPQVYCQAYATSAQLHDIFQHHRGAQADYANQAYQPFHDSVRNCHLQANGTIDNNHHIL